MKTRKQKILNWILIIVMAAFSLLFLFPLIWMIFNSFKGDAAIAHDLHSFAAFLPPALSSSRRASSMPEPPPTRSRVR